MTITNFTMPPVTIVTPSFQQAKFLEETMQSVLNQAYPFLNYVVIDGGSTDGSVDIIKKYADRLAYWVSEPDAGQSDAINKGFQQADEKTIIIGWLNSDDVLLPNAVLKAVRTFQNHPDAALVYGDVLSINEHGSVINEIKYGDWQLQDLMTFHMIGQPAVFTRFKLFAGLGGLDTSYHYLMDHHLWLRLALEGEMVHIPEFLAKARMHSDAKNVAKAANFGADAFRLVGWMRGQPYTRKVMAKDGFDKKVESAAHRFNARYLLDAGKPRQAFREYWRSFRLDSQTCLVEWHRWLFALLSMFGLGFLKNIFYRSKHARYGRKY
jgi:glycosyltransferase involved in cell wall biosynthesis